MEKKAYFKPEVTLTSVLVERPMLNVSYVEEGTVDSAAGKGDDEDDEWINLGKGHTQWHETGKSRGYDVWSTWDD